MNLHFVKYLAIFIGPVLAMVSLTYTGWLAFALPLYAFAFIPLVELFINPKHHNLNKLEEEIAKEDRLYDYLIYSLVPIQYGILFYFCYTITQPNLTTLDVMARVLTMGIGCVTFGINVAHELGHRRTKFEQFLSKSLLVTSLYMHFFIEHNRGHHKNVATEEDPASARYGEILYAFWGRTITGSYLSAWRLEAERLQNTGKAFFSWHNEMIWYQIIQVGFAALIGAIFGWTVLGYFLLAATLGILFFETVNYLEHYGLQRKKNADGVYERVLPVHSWNSDHIIGRLMLFEVSRHSDHHHRASRKYQILRSLEEAPQLPTGYPAMILLSFIPPLWFYVMHKQIAKYRKQYGEVLA